MRKIGQGGFIWRVGLDQRDVAKGEIDEHMSNDISEKGGRAAEYAFGDTCTVCLLAEQKLHHSQCSARRP